MILPLIMTVFGSLCYFGSECDPADVYDLLYDEALYNCPNAGSENIDLNILDILVKVEKEYDIPCSLRGMLLAAACYESGYNPEALGDRSFSKRNKPLAVGILQLWPWWTKAKYGYNVDRRNPEQSARAWMSHIASRLPKVKKSCRFKDKERLWVAAWVHAIRKPKKGGRCYEKPNHLKLLKKWHKSIKKNCNIIGC
jgi:hypothetical protein